MLVLNLGCAQGHRFEGWFGSAQDFESQQSRGLISCPLCSSVQVQRLPSAPRLNVAHLRAQKSASTVPADQESRQAPSEALPDAVGAPEAAAQQLQQLAMQALRQLIGKTEDVGERFAEEARRMHYGEAEERAIRGRATPQQAQELVEEGIELIALPEPLKSNLQ